MQSKIQPSILESQYVPLQRFMGSVLESRTAPYPTRFSFGPLIRQLESKQAELDEDLCLHSIALLKEFEAELRGNDSTDLQSLFQKPQFAALLAVVFPAFFIDEKLGFISALFGHPNDFGYRTRELEKLMNSENWEIRLSAGLTDKAAKHYTFQAGSLILNRFYGRKLNLVDSQEITLRRLPERLEKHYQVSFITDFVEIKPQVPLPELNREQIYELLDNPRDEELWTSFFPPENFLFEGFVIGVWQDTSKTTIVSNIKELMGVEGGKMDQMQLLDYIQNSLRSLLEIPNLEFGSLQNNDAPWVESSTWSLLRHYNKEMVKASFAATEGPYGRLLATGEPVIVVDLEQESTLPPLEQALLDKGIRSLLLAPMYDEEGNIVSFFELASAQEYQFSQYTLFQLEEVIPLLNAGSNRFIRDTMNAIRLTIQQEFTSIHPSVEWKFSEVAGNYYWNQVVADRQSSLDPIVFKDVYPLYGQADIVGSSRQRNEAIRADLIDNLERLQKLLVSCREAVPFHLLGVYQYQLEKHLGRLKGGAFVSNDESLIVELLTQEIHPLLKNLAERFSQLPHPRIRSYFDYIDPELDIVYRRRKAYEDSVRQLNQMISYHLVQEEEKMQRILPHYFEKFETDGVEYNLYLGQSLLEKDRFDDFYLRDFRLWQLILMCEVTRLVEEKSGELPVPLTTAQLIFVYSNSLSIRFLMDEKQFDVDGAYNVRYEILKKRIDKAYIKGTQDRLTQSGKIAIVWLQERDRREYSEYLQYLVQKRYISERIETVDLENMQGVEGLKAFRVEVLPRK